MESDCITYQESGYFSNLLVDYFEDKESIRPFYNRRPTISSFEGQLVEKKKSYTSNQRAILVAALERQQANSQLTHRTKQNLLLLRQENTFTITTGHQLNLFTGPVYFLYKIISVIKTCEELQSHYPTYHFVPVFWMATEDHDFDEINHFFVQEKKITWKKSSQGPVGRLDTKGLDWVAQELQATLGTGEKAKELLDLFQRSYCKHDNLAAATRYLVNELFGSYGLVIIDGDDRQLKSSFQPIFLKELEQQFTFQEVSKTIQRLDGYPIQVNPRAINLFYMDNGYRERIIPEAGKFKLHVTGTVFTREALLETLQNYPEKFSPNVIVRPLYQEFLLPNLAYIGGAGEIAYWLELQDVFKSVSVPFPILMVRNSVLLYTQKQMEKMKKMDLDWKDLFLKQSNLIQKKAQSSANQLFDFSKQEVFLKSQFETLKNLVSQTDRSFEGAVKAQEVKQLKGLHQLEKKLIRAQKKKETDYMQRMILLQNELFPNQTLQERRLNFCEIYLEKGKDFIDDFRIDFEPFETKFNLIKL